MERAIPAYQIGRLYATEIFGRIHATNAWRGNESVSGPGSDVSRCVNIITHLPKLFRDFEIRSMLDVPCGDWNWMKDVELSGVDYIGGDIVPEIVSRNGETYARPSVQFEVMDMVRDDIPTADLVLCRDGLVHLSFDDGLNALKRIKASDSKFLLCTTFRNPERKNEDVKTGGWRALNMEKEPFNFPPALRVISECGINEYADKSLALWLVEELM